jgi:hypothetical protein
MMNSISDSITGGRFVEGLCEPEMIIMSDNPGKVRLP